MQYGHCLSWRAETFELNGTLTGTLCAHWLELYAPPQGGAQGQNSPGTPKMGPKMSQFAVSFGLYLRLAA